MVHIGGGIQRNADPSAVRKDVMGLRRSLPNQLIPDLHGKREIGKIVAMDVSQFSPSVPYLHAPESMGGDAHTFPGGNGIKDFLLSRDIHEPRNSRFIVIVTVSPATSPPVSSTLFQASP